MKLHQFHIALFAGLTMLLSACQEVVKPAELIKVDLTEGPLNYKLQYAQGDVCLGYDYSQDLGKLRKVTVGYDVGFYVEWAKVIQVAGCHDVGNPECFDTQALKRKTISGSDAKKIQALIADLPAFEQGDTCSAGRCAHEEVSIPENQLTIPYTDVCSEGGEQYHERAGKLLDGIKGLIPGYN